MLARAEALQRVEKAHHEVGIYVLFLLVFFCCLDLVPLTMKVTHLISTGGVYEKVSAALRERDAVHAHQIQEEALVLRRRISGEARAEEAVDQVEIDVDRRAPDPHREREARPCPPWGHQAGLRARRLTEPTGYCSSSKELSPLTYELGRQ